MRQLIRLARIPIWRFAAAAGLGVVAAVAGVALLGASGYLVCRASQQPPILALGAVIVMVRALALLRPLARYSERLAGHDLTFRWVGQVRTAVLRRIEPLPDVYADGDLLSRLVNDIDDLQDLVLRVLLPVSIAVPAALLVCLGVATQDPTVAVILAVGLGAAAVVPPLIAHRTTVRAQTERVHLRSVLTARLVDTLSAAEELWLSGAEQPAIDALQEDDAALRRGAARDARGAGLADAAALGLSGLTAVVVLWVTTTAVREGRLDPLMVAPLTMVAAAAFETVSPLSAAARRVPSVRAAAARVVELVSHPVEVGDPATPTEIAARPAIDLRGVEVRRGPSRTVVLRDLDLELEPGGRLVISGRSGVGKTTLLQVVTRMLERSAGRVELDGVELRSHSQHAVRREILLMGQDPYVFNTDLRENVRLARPGAGDADVLAALDRAQLGRWVRELPEGLDTRVGSEGALLSSGQRQRLAMARAFLADPSVLLLDEPTAHLDADNGDRLLADIWDQVADRSVILVTHSDPGPFAACPRVEIGTRDDAREVCLT